MSAGVVSDRFDSDSGLVVSFGSIPGTHFENYGEGIPLDYGMGRNEAASLELSAMKSGTLGHIKVKKLKLRLKIPLWQAAGIIETLWQFGSDCADDGTVGRYSNEDIAAYMEWEGDPDELVGALIACRFLDEDDELRLVIHDWLEHCPNYVKERVRKRQERTPAPKPRTSVSVSEQTPDMSAPCPDETRTSLSQSELTHLTNPNPTQPNQGNPNPPSRALRFDASDFDIAQWMFGLIQAMQPDRRQPNLESWANSIRLMREQDGRAPPDIRSLFEWCNRDAFWKTNVLSPDKLREKWDDLQLKRKSNGSKPSQQSAGKQFTEGATCDFA